MTAEGLLARRGVWISLTTAIVLAGSILRLGYLLTPAIDSDQAVFGLQGLHVLKGEFPAFSWGYAYIGTLQSYVDAAFFWVFGPSRRVLNFVPFLFWLGYLAAMRSIAASLFAERLHQAVAFALAAISPQFFTVHGIWGRHGYPETFCFGSVLLAMICASLGKRPSPRRHFLLLAIAGLAWWSDFLIIYYFVPLAVYELQEIVRAPRWRERLWIAAAATAGFFSGSLPFWIYNVRHHFASLNLYARPRDLAAVLRITVQKVLPVLFGAKIFLNPRQVPVLWLALTLFWTFATGFVIARYAGRAARAIRSSALDPEALVWLLLVAIFGIYLTTSFSSSTESTSMRYLLPFYTVYPLVPGLFFSGLPRKLRGPWFPWLAGFLVSMTLANNLLASPLTDREARRAYAAGMDAESKIFDALAKTGKRQFIMFDYWRAPLWTFDSGERFIIADPDTRYPRYLSEMLREKTLAYLVDPQPDPSLALGFAALGFTCSTTALPSLTLLSDFRQVSGGAVRAVPGAVVTAAAGRPASSAGNLRDGDIRTSQDVSLDPGPAVVLLGLDRARPVRGLSIYLGNRFLAPYAVTVRDGRTGKTLLETGAALSGFTVLDQPLIPPAPDYLEVFFPASVTDRLTVEFSLPAAGSLPMSEIVVYEETGGDHPDSSVADGLPGAASAGFAGKGYRVTASLGTRWRAEELFPKVDVAMPMLAGVDLDFRRPNAIFFEASWLEYNRAVLERAGVEYRAYRAGGMACLITRPAPGGRASMNGKGLFLAGG